MTSATTAAEAAARSALIDVRSYHVHLDLTAGPESVRSLTEIEFGCRRPGATTFADLDPVAITRALLNGAAISHQAAAADGRLQLSDLAAENTLVVDAIVAAAPGGRGLAWYTDPADGGQYVLVSCYPTDASRVFCCFDQLDLRADLTLTVTAPAGWQCVASGTVIERPAPGSAGVWRFSPARAIKPYDLTLCARPVPDRAWRRRPNTSAADRAQPGQPGRST